jgi:putative alpha-1,2-mannosidase
MTGTSSDAAFSDAYVSGAVTDLSTALNIYNSGMNDAFLDSGSNNAGRKGIKYSQFLGYVPKTDEE